MDDQRDFTLILKSRFPIVVVETHEETRVLALLERISNLEGWALFTWSVTDGLKRLNNRDPVTQTYSPTDCLRHIDATSQNGLYVLLDAHPFLADPLNVRLIKEIALGYAKTPRTLVLVSHRLEMPPELGRLAARFQLSLPDAQRIRALLNEEFQLWERDSGEKVRGQRDAVLLLERHLLGLTLEDARRIVRQAVRDDGMVTLADVERAQKAKFDMLGMEGLVSLELDTAQFSQVGGQARLKRWLALRQAAFTGDAGALDPPKGILLLGVQGSGKSLAARAVAGVWGLPLLRLDFAALYNKWHGETERNLREALKMAEAMAPSVLWIDEIEKGLATDSSGGTDGGVSRRVLGTLLTWMAERKARVFLVATSNDVSGLPPELMRKGRLDEIFFVDLPDEPTRSEIFAIHLRRRKLEPDDFDLPALGAAAAGFSGAEIEQAVVSALYEAHAGGVALDTALVREELARTRPLSVVRAEELAALREWASGRTVAAN